MGYKLTPPTQTENYDVTMFVTCCWRTFLKDGTQADYEAEFEGFPAEAQCAEGIAACIAFARAQEVQA